MREDLTAAMRPKPRFRGSLGTYLGIGRRNDRAVLLSDVPLLVGRNDMEIWHGSPYPRGYAQNAGRLRVSAPALANAGVPPELKIRRAVGRAAGFDVAATGSTVVHMDDQIVAGARDAAKDLGYEITSSAVQHQQDEYTGYSFAFDAHGEEVGVELLVSRALVLRSGLTPRDYARHEILDALRRSRGGDMRATERLLEFIAEQRAIASNWTTDPAAKDALEQIERAVTELRRRGDILVRREDLRLLVEASEDALIVTDREAIDQALVRIESALGGS